VSRSADVDFILRTPRLFSSAAWKIASSGNPNAAQKVPSLLSMDPPDHTRLRTLANTGFTPRLIRAMEPRVQAIIHDVLDPLTQQTEGDLVPMLSVPLPNIVIAGMLGVEVERQTDFTRWSDALVRALSRLTDQAVRAEIRQSVRALYSYVERMIHRRRRAPGDDLISALVQAEEERQLLTPLEILGLAVLL
jgi:cytochrome P450